MNSTAHVGAVGELFVCNYFLAFGLEVCRNVAASGPIDIVVFNKANGKLAAIDVKSLRAPYVKSDGSFSIGQKVCLREDGVWQIVYVHGEMSPRLPEGFWEVLGMETA
jgi:hypothetical protein